MTQRRTLESCKRVTWPGDTLRLLSHGSLRRSWRTSMTSSVSPLRSDPPSVLHSHRARLRRRRSGPARRCREAKRAPRNIGGRSDRLSGAELPASLVVRLVDDQGNVVLAAIVSWSVESDGGTVVPSTALPIQRTWSPRAGLWGPHPVPTASRPTVAPGVDAITFSANATGGGRGCR